MNEPCERPILFSSAMVKAILEGRKVQTRRTCSSARWWRHVQFIGGKDDNHDDPTLWGYADEWGDWWTLAKGPDGDALPCPYGRAGERLWVKETIRLGPPQMDGRASGLYADGTYSKLDTWPWQRHVLTAIHCPRGLSRITLEVTDVRVERLQSITNADAIAEGCAGGSHVEGYSEANPADPYEECAALWDSINQKRAPWNSNPWVWVISFRRIS